MHCRQRQHNEGRAKLQGTFGRRVPRRAVLVLACTFLSIWGLHAGEARDTTPTRSFTFVHLSDTHCSRATVNPPAPGDGRDPYVNDLVNSFGHLKAAVEQINKRIRPDFVIHTGDVVDDGRDLDSLRRARDILDRLRCPYYPVIGNHDSRAHWRTVFGPGRFNYAFEHGHWRFIAVDASRGRMPKPTLAWLKERLEDGSEKPTAVLLHHPLVLSKQYIEIFKARYRGSPLLRNASEVLSVLREDTSAVRAVFCGHLHRAVRIGYGRLTLAVAPALVRPPAHRMYIVKVNGDDVKISSTSTARGPAW